MKYKRKNYQVICHRHFINTGVYAGNMRSRGEMVKLINNIYRTFQSEFGESSLSTLKRFVEQELKNVNIPTKLELKAKKKELKPAKVKPIKSKAPSDMDFYLSWEWKKLRYNILLRYGAQCMCCGATPSTAVIVVDHIMPRKKFPALAMNEDNLQVLCQDCNMGKSNNDYTDFRIKY